METFLELSTEAGDVTIKASEIVMLMQSGSRTQVHTRDRVVLAKESVKQISNMLRDASGPAELIEQSRRVLDKLNDHLYTATVATGNEIVGSGYQLTVQMEIREQWQQEWKISLFSPRLQKTWLARATNNRLDVAVDDIIRKTMGVNL